MNLRTARRAIARILAALGRRLVTLAEDRIDVCLLCGRNPQRSAGCINFNYYGTAKSRHLDREVA